MAGLNFSNETEAEHFSQTVQGKLINRAKKNGECDLITPLGWMLTFVLFSRKTCGLTSTPERQLSAEHSAHRPRSHLVVYVFASVFFSFES